MIARIAVATPAPGFYHYNVPPRLEHGVSIGRRVLVPFGNRGVAGVVVGFDDEIPEGVERMREIRELLPGAPISAELVELCLWVSEYYAAAPGEVLRAALPPGSGIDAKLVVELTDKGRAAIGPEGTALARVPRELLHELNRRGGRLRQALLLKGRGKVADLDELVRQGLAIHALDSGKARVRARTVRVAVVAVTVDDSLRVSLGRAKRRLAVLDHLVAAGGELTVEELRELDGQAATHLRALAKDGIVRIEERAAELVAVRLGQSLASAQQAAPPTLTATQTDVVERLVAALETSAFAPYLLHGVTGSGKTEVYLRLIAEAQRAGRGAIVLVPEISLTPQLAGRFRSRFGDAVAVLHSGLTARERFDEWQRLQTGVARIAVGARSAIFAPITNLGVIVVDEEHDSSFKQEEGVRYHARDVALVRAKQASAVCVLGSATPSLESYHRAQSGRLGLLEMPERPTPSPLPVVEVIDLKQQQPDRDSLLTAALAEAVAATLSRGEQSILFLNRRGFSTFVVCIGCGTAARCPNCSVSLTYHRHSSRMLCHYCAHSEPAREDCMTCGGKGTVSRRGLGTEKIADAISTRFPEARIGRLDRDVAKDEAVESILARVARREVDILVGTQMVTKGHDFPGVTLVGVLLADTGLSLPDFRASERTFQLLTQVAGRAGRGDQAGRVIVQTYRPDAIAVTYASRHDFRGFFDAEVALRRELDYPPWGYVVAVRLDGENASAVAKLAGVLAARARAHPSEVVSVLGPAEAPLSRLKGRTRWHVWLKSADRSQLRRYVHGLLDGVDLAAGIRISVDVDPISAL